MEAASPTPDVLQTAMLEEQAANLFSLCDPSGRGFVVSVDLLPLVGMITTQQMDSLTRRIEDREDRFIDREQFIEAVKDLLVHPNYESKGEADNNNDFHSIRLESESDSERDKSVIAPSTTPQPQLCVQESPPPVDPSSALPSPLRSPTQLHPIPEESIPEKKQHRPSSPVELLPPHMQSALRGMIASPSLADEIAIFDHDSPSSAEYPYRAENTPIEETNPMFEAPPIIKKRQFRPMLPEVYDPYFTAKPKAPQSLADELYEAAAPPRADSREHRVIPTELDMRTPDRIFKVVFVGDSAVGKTCFLHRFCHDRFKPLFNATVGVDFTVKTVQYRDRLIALQLWDTAGQERFRSITKQYFRKADGVVLMYDVTSEQSFLHVRGWIESVRAGVDETAVMCLVANKVDLFASEQLRHSMFKTGKRIADEFNMLFFETSAFTGYGIQECMHDMAGRLHQREEDHLEEVLKLGMEPETKKRSWCCV